MIQTYEPIQGMIICVSGGGYVTTEDHLKEIEKLNTAIKELEAKLFLSTSPFRVD